MNKKIIFIVFSIVSILYSLTLILAYDYRIELDSNNKYKCNITTDDITKQIKLKNKEIIKDDFKYFINLSCNQSLKTYKLYIFQDDIIVKQLNNRYYELTPKTLKTNNLINCTINKDGNKKELETKETFLDTFTIECKTSQIMGIEVDNIYYNKLNTSKFTYNKDSISKQYNTEIYFNDNFNKSNKCTLTTDKTKIEKTFNLETDRKDYKLNNSVGNIINLNCQYKVKEIQLFIDDRQWNKEYYKNTYLNTSIIKIEIDKLNISKIPIKKKIVSNNRNKTELPKTEEIIIKTPTKYKPKIKEYNLSNEYLMSQETNLYKLLILLN